MKTIKPTHADIEKLLRTLVLPFYHVKRTMPLPIGERRLENDAEHSWSLAFLACSLAPQIDPKLDVGKICQFATIHDIVEVYADDTSTFDSEEKIASKTEREEGAMEKITNEFSHFPWITGTLTDYERKDTDEALFVYALDKYIAVTYDYMDKGRYLREQKITQSKYAASLASHRDKAHTHHEVGYYYDEVRTLLDAHPEYFHAK